MLARTFAGSTNWHGTWKPDPWSWWLLRSVTLIARYGIEEISALAGVLAEPLQKGKANIDLHLPERRRVSLRLKLGAHQPIEWVEQMRMA